MEAATPVTNRTVAGIELPGISMRIVQTDAGAAEQWPWRDCGRTASDVEYGFVKETGETW